MKIKWGKIRRFLFGLPLINIENTWKNVPNVETPTRKQLRPPVIAFATGMNTAIEVALSDLLIGQLDGFNDNCRGFAYEGAGMGLAIIDLSRNKGLIPKFLKAEGANYSELIHIGIGCAIAVLKKELEPKLKEIEPMQRWWLPDGFGFFTGIYKWEETVDEQLIPSQIKGHSLRAFDRGLGRRMWFAFSGDPKAIANTISTFPKSRQIELWSGVGIASTFAGGVERETLLSLKQLAGDSCSYLALGSALAAKCRYTAGNIIEYTNLACSILCGMSASDASIVVVKALEELEANPNEPLDVAQPVFETMREHVRNQLARTLVTV
ncbi:DUF1702 family protein [Leptolyngbyaceae cyanobacterium CCMR0082]|uniref:DUF1702 family protein n=1 Tax=Adonisia turfae CCMR0082 TaxID=2304604 RepID=A0A6M0S5E3_9CYAN|nr:DUF1702 family protein [Adonisia turfae]NEZ63615.1 DUF1702 family protein [Adonisia turfae CCMR0082]